MKTLFKKSVCVKILPHANIQARKAALGRNYFSRRNNFGLHGSRLFSLFLSANGEKSKIDWDDPLNEQNVISATRGLSIKHFKQQTEFGDIVK